MKKKCFIFYFLTLIACQASVSNYEKFLNSWIGQSEAQLVTSWGAPVDMQTIAPGRQIFTYIQERQIPVPGAEPTQLGQGSLYTVGNDDLGTIYDYYCKITFTTQDDIIVDYSWSGDGCLMK
ncbi:MAG: hypothetical protein J6Y03_04935 [Alphaproteobacteria bacterium]|nr:hypothetical protein [Alphaproteobacteria bacterium]